MENKDDKENLVLALAHKLRTPLNGARWVIETLMSQEEGEKKDLLRESHNKIIESINIVSEILKSTNHESNDSLLEIKKEKVNLCNIVDGILKNLNFLIQEKNIELNYDKCDSATIYGDKKMLDIALTNLFDNACRYSPNGKVSVFLSKDISTATLVIKDSGIGISKEDLVQLYEKFFRGKNAKELDPDESGVGLFTTKKIIEMHNGEIKIESEVTKGTTVTVTLPLD